MSIDTWKALSMSGWCTTGAFSKAVFNLLNAASCSGPHMSLSQFFLDAICCRGPTTWLYMTNNKGFFVRVFLGEVQGG